MSKKFSYAIELKKPRKGATDAAMSKFERSQKVKIPREYREFLKCQNGGKPQNRNVAWGKKGSQNTVLRCFLSIDPVGESSLAIAFAVYEGRIPAALFPIATDEFDNKLLISQQRGTTNQIFFWDHEKELTTNRPEFVAKDLKTLLGLLKPDEIEEYEIATITYRDGEVQRQGWKVGTQPVKFISVDRKRVVLITSLKVGEKIDDFGEIRKIAKIVYTRE